MRDIDDADKPFGDLVVFDPDTVRPKKEDIVRDLSNNGWLIREPAEGIHHTVVVVACEAQGGGL